jgi:hypothetical protein
MSLVSRKGLQRHLRGYFRARKPFANCKKRLSFKTVGMAQKSLFGVERFVAR